MLLLAHYALCAAISYFQQRVLLHASFVPLTLKSCQQLKILRASQSGSYKINPDGQGVITLTMLSIPSKITESVICEFLDQHLGLVLQENH